MKIKYLHINRESVLPLGKDTVQIHPIPPRFIDTVFSIGYIVGDISKKELTAMPRINDGRKKFIAFILIIILSFLCVCSHSDHSCSVHTGHTANAEGTQLSENHAESSLESGNIKTPDANRIIEANIVYNVRTGEQLTRSRQNVKGFEELLDCAGVHSLMQTAFMSAYIPVLITRGKLTPRYVIVVYLHLCDGKKSVLLSHV